MQSRLGSIVESSVSTVAGFLTAMALWQLVVAPYFGYDVTLETNVQITAIFAAASLVQKYIWRRVFEQRMWQLLVRRKHGKDLS